MNLGNRQDQAKIERQVRKELAEQCVKRASRLCFLWACAFGILSFTTYPYLSIALPTLTIWQNFWPRILFSTIPFIAFGIFLLKSKYSAASKVYLAMAFQGLQFNVAGLTYVWKASLTCSPIYLLHINGMNVAYFLGLWVFMCPPSHMMLKCAGIFAATILAPLLTVAYAAGDLTIFQTILSDALNGTMTTLFAAFLSGGLYRKIEILKQQQATEASKYLGETLHSAIFEGKRKLLKEEICSGYVVVMDIRESSKLTREFGPRWAEFSKRWFEAASRTIPKHQGHLLKTVGDCIVVTFGIFDEQVDLSDIPGIQREVAEAEARRWDQLTKNCLSCTDSLFKIFQDLSTELLPEVSMRIGAGIDRGPVIRGTRGSAERMELDIWGDRVNCASRLEAYSKVIAPKFASATSSVLVVSPFATDYMKDLSGFQKIETASEPIKDFHGIRWVLAREYKAPSIAQKRAA